MSEKLVDAFYASIRTKVDERGSESHYRKQFMSKSGAIFNKENQLFTLNGKQISLESVLFAPDSVLVQFVKEAK